MKHICLVCTLVVIALLPGCKEESFKKGKDGLEYKILSKGGGQKVKAGDFMQIHVGQYYTTGKKDSLMSDSRTANGAMIEKIDSSSIPPNYFEILSQLKKNDSLVIRILTDSAFAKSPQGMPAMFKKGNYLTTTVKVLDIFTSQAQADSARKVQMVQARSRDSIENIENMAKDDKTLQDYFRKNNIQVSKAPQGTYVQIIQPGTGPLIDTSVVVKTNYTGRTMDGKMFDSNTDTSKGHVEPFSVNMTNNPTLGGRVITGWTDGLTLLNKGAKAKFYIPSSLAYGKRGAGQDIAPNSILMFDIEVLDVLSKEMAMADIKEKKSQMKAKQDRYMDSVKKSKPDTTKSK